MPDVVLPALDEARAIPAVLASLPCGLRPDRRRQRFRRRNGDGRAPPRRARGRRAAARLRRGVLRRSARGNGRRRVLHGLRRLPRRSRISRASRNRSSPATLISCSAPGAPSADAWPLHARLANRALAFEVRRRTTLRVRDLGPMRAAPREKLLTLGLVDRRFGWPLEMVLRAWQDGLAHRGGRRAVRAPRRPFEGDRHGRRDDPHDARHGAAPPMNPDRTTAGRCLDHRHREVARTRARQDAPVSAVHPPRGRRHRRGRARRHARRRRRHSRTRPRARARRRTRTVDARWLRHRPAARTWARRTTRQRVRRSHRTGGPHRHGHTAGVARPARRGDGRRCSEPDVDAVLGLATDGGWWAIGLRHADPRVFVGVPMSTDHTGADQLARLRSLGYRTRSARRTAGRRHVRRRARGRRTDPDSRFAAAINALDRAEIATG